MKLLEIREYARYGLAFASICIIVGAILMFTGELNLGDGIMIFGTVLLLASAFALASTPTGDNDAGR